MEYKNNMVLYIQNMRDIINKSKMSFAQLKNTKRNIIYNEISQQIENGCYKKKNVKGKRVCSSWQENCI